MINTGYLGHEILREYNKETGNFTGNTKPNIPGDPDYVAPVEDIEECPLLNTYYLVYSSSAKDACNASLDYENPYYVDKPSLFQIKKIFVKINGVYHYANPGYYSDFFGVIYFDGENVTSAYESCQNY